MPLILGIDFFEGDVEAIVTLMSGNGGFLIAPSGTCFARLQRDDVYRSAVANADYALADSGLMVVLWRLVGGQKVPRISGLRYLKSLCARLSHAEHSHPLLWVVPSERARGKLSAWLAANEMSAASNLFYIAPFYGKSVSDENLLGLIVANHPHHVLIGIGSGPQEKLGYYLRQNLAYRPAIHCIGAALGFLTGDQRPIPDWADRFYLGWLLRFLRQPHLFGPRYLSAFKLPGLIFRHGRHLPPLTEK